MSIIIDLIIVGIIALCVFFGYKKGLTGSILKIISFILALILAFILYKPVANLLIENTDWDNNIKNSIVGMLKGEVEEKGKIDKETTNLPDIIVNHINEALEQTIGKTKTQILEEVAEGISTTIINAGAFIGVLIIARILLIVVRFFAKFITDLPLIKQVDKTGGIIYGVVEGLVIIWIIVSIISFVSPVMEGSGIVEAINKSFLGGILYNNNLLLKIIF